jgi:hypothetical protein
MTSHPLWTSCRKLEFPVFQVSISGAWIPNRWLYKGSRIRLVSLRVCSGAPTNTIIHVVHGSAENSDTSYLSVASRVSYHDPYACQRPNERPYRFSTDNPGTSNVCRLGSIVAGFISASLRSPARSSLVNRPRAESRGRRAPRSLGAIFQRRCCYPVRRSGETPNLSLGGRHTPAVRGLLARQSWCIGPVLPLVKLSLSTSTANAISQRNEKRLLTTTRPLISGHVIVHRFHRIPTA